MATVKLKFRLSVLADKEGTIYYQVIHNRVVRQIVTDYKLFRPEWDGLHQQIVVAQPERAEFVQKIQKKVERDLQKLREIVAELREKTPCFSVDDVVVQFYKSRFVITFFGFMEEIIDGLRKLGKVRTAESYTAALNSFAKFRCNRDLKFDEFTADLVMSYEVWLKTTGVRPNTSSYYIRNLRAVYNRAVERNLVTQNSPFRCAYTGVEKTVKRAVPLKIVRKIRELELSDRPSLDFARNMFLFSFYTRGMSFIDMAYLRKKDLKDGVLIYRRCKTGRLMCIKWENFMQQIVDRYDTSDSIYLLPIIRTADSDARRQYMNIGHRVNRGLHIIGRRLNLSKPLTMYVARHTWASIAHSKNVPLSVISDALGHDSESTTRIYLATLDNMEVDRANRLIFKLL